MNEDFIREHLRELAANDRQGVVADQLGISRSQVSLIVSGKRRISANVAARLGYKTTVVYTPTRATAAISQRIRETPSPSAAPPMPSL